MGVSGLMRDLRPYATSATIGYRSGPTSSMHVTNIVIDGPSFVYHVCNRLLSHSNSTHSAIPEYEDIDRCVLSILADLEMAGAKIVSIFFDGALPVSKRSVRQERLEKSRSQLSQYRRLHPEPSLSWSVTPDVSISQLLWHSNTTPARQRLPHPPFMVASAIEALLKSRWSELVGVVPGEADSFCADRARATKAAILSNDSDLLLYHLGDAVGLINLDSLQLDETVSTSTNIKALVIQPRVVAQKLSIPDLLEYGLYRYLDVHSSVSVIAGRARDLQKVLKTSEAEAFRQTYSLSPSARTSPGLSGRGDESLLNGLDPRTAEFVCSYQFGTDLHVYLPILLEDHDRTSSWIYGQALRRQAYSILCCTCRASSEKSQIGVATEHVRRGNDIAEVVVQPLAINWLSRELTRINGLHVKYISTATHNDDVNRILFCYYMLAMHIVIEQQVAKSGKELASFRRVVYGSTRDDKPNSWDDIHSLANTHAVLYSLRILVQVLRYISKTSGFDKEHIEQLNTLLRISESMPNISNLFYQLDTLRAKFYNLPLEFKNAAFEEMLRNVYPDKSSGSNPMTSTTITSKTDSNQNKPFVPQDKKSKRIRQRARAKSRQLQSTTPSNGATSAQKTLADQTTPFTSHNVFAALANS